MSKHIIIDKLPKPPNRPVDGHKGTFGTVIIIGGTQTMPGAPALTARAAFRTGCGLVKIAADENTLPVCLTIEPGATGILIAQTCANLEEAIASADPNKKAVLAIGPGLSQSADKWRAIQKILQDQRPVVLDADGLNLLAAANYQHNQKGAPVIMTPHPGEFSRLMRAANIKYNLENESARIEAATALANYHCAVVVLKGHKTIVSDGEKIFINNTGNPTLATAGSGDVLTGAIASLLAQGMELFNAAVLAVNIHGSAADLWAKNRGESGLLARELADNLVQSLNTHRA